MMQDISHYDQLTGMLTRAAFQQAFGEAMAQARSQGAALTLALIDIDRFKQINDQYGHAGGDAVLEAVGEALKRVEGGIAARYGGDEFALLFPAVEREQVLLRLERTRAEVEAMSAIANAGGQIEMHLTISAGIAAFPIDGEEENELLRKADGALYRAKIGGRNKVMLAYEERMAPKTAHFTLTQLERLASLAKDQGVGEAVLLREALDDLLVKYEHSFRK